MTAKWLKKKQLGHGSRTDTFDFLPEKYVPAHRAEFHRWVRPLQSYHCLVEPHELTKQHRPRIWRPCPQRNFKVENRYWGVEFDALKKMSQCSWKRKATRFRRWRSEGYTVFILEDLLSTSNRCVENFRRDDMTLIFWFQRQIS